MFLRVPNCDKVISLLGKGLDIIRLPDKDDTGNTMQFALVIVHNTADPPPTTAPPHLDFRQKDAYWAKFEGIAECESHDAGDIRLGQPLEPLLDKICAALRRGEHLLDVRSEKTYLSLADVQEMSEKAERKQREREARKAERKQRQKDFTVKL